MEMILIGPDLVPRGRLRWTSCSWVPRWNAGGSWNAQIDGEDRISKRIEPGCHVRVLDDQGQTYSGLILTYNPSQTSSGRLNINLSGIDHLGLLKFRVTYPNPAKSWSVQDTQYYTDSGPVSPVVHSLVLRNIGAAALGERSFPGLVVDTAATGPSTSVKTRFNVLADEVNALAMANGVKNELFYGDDRKLHFRCRATADRSRSMVLRQDRNTLGAWDLSLTMPEATTFLMGGQGEGTARMLRAYSIPSELTWGYRVEAFKDQRDAQDAAEMDKAGADLVAAEAGSAAITLSASEGLKVYGRDYQLGDIVTAQLLGVPYTERLQAAQVDWDEKGRKVELTLGKGQDQDNAAPAWVRRVRDISRAMRRLETR